MMMYSSAATAPTATRHLRRRREDDYDATNAFMHPTAFNTYSPTSCPQPHKKFKASLQDHVSRFQQQPTTPNTWYDAADVSSPDSDDMDTSMDVDMLDDDDVDDDVPTPAQWNDAQVVQYAQPNGAQKTHATLEIVGNRGAQFKPRPVLVPSSRIEEVFDEPAACNALVVYRPPPPAGSWKVEPESESDDERVDGTLDVVDDGDMMDID